jgi:hypothetical protein
MGVSIGQLRTWYLASSGRASERAREREHSYTDVTVFKT